MGLRFVCITALREIRTFHTIFTHNGVKILLNIYYNLLSFHQILSVEAFIFFTIFFLLIFTSYHVKIFFKYLVKMRMQFTILMLLQKEFQPIVCFLHYI